MTRAEQDLASLTERERLILRLIASGRTTKEIAEQLSISYQTVATHRKHICYKLQVHSTAALVALATRTFTT
jgi:DNA-binding CsgD family transcriptional regulator